MTPFIKKLAVEMKSAMATGFTLDDIGIVLEDEVHGACGTGHRYPGIPSVREVFGMCDEAFSALCDEVISALPSVKADPRSVGLHRQASRDFHACEQAEHRAFALDA